MIIDGHLHISYLGEKKKNLFDVKESLKASMKANGIDYAVPIPDNEPNPQCADMDTLFKLIEGETQFFPLGTVNIFQDVEKQVKQLKQLLTAKKIHGVKLFPGHDPFFPTDKRCNPVYELCQELDYPIIVHTGENTGDSECAKYNDPKYLVEISKKYPNLKIVIAHFFWPKMKYCYELTKDLKNIYYDTSAMADPEVTEATGGWDKVRSILKKTVLLKPDNVIFGTDWPMCPVDKHIQMIKELKVGPIIEEKIFFLNAVRIYKLDI